MPTFFFVTAGLLLLCADLLREFEVGSAGTIGRSAAAHRLTIAVAVCTVITAYFTLMRLSEAL
ncbi:hypothetical protein V1Y59_08020 [Gordonia sp. PKS22-38]|uniref:Uncharacterized protein n=1 Tax=Gordonia prachuapensis TaxID=3115651 RepID=A0ABU7MTB4_9ACTN|nr:hypothetical protein [Gordonia sp. PKS22-38]